MTGTNSLGLSPLRMFDYPDGRVFFHSCCATPKTFAELVCFALLCSAKTTHKKLMKNKSLSGVLNLSVRLARGGKTETKWQALREWQRYSGQNEFTSKERMKSFSGFTSIVCDVVAFLLLFRLLFLQFQQIRPFARSVVFS